MDERAAIDDLKRALDEARRERDEARSVLVEKDRLTERLRTAVECARTGEVLRTNEDKYRTLFESIDEGVTIIETVRDDDGRLIDLIYREANEAYARQTGFQSYPGLRVKEIVPDIEGDWIAFTTECLRPACRRKRRASTLT